MVEVSNERIKERYQEVKDKVEFKTFRDDVFEAVQNNDISPFMTEDSIIDMIVEKYAERENIRQVHPNQIQKIKDLIVGNGNITIQARILAISNIKTFKTKSDKEGKVANLTVEDDTGKVRVVMWTNNMKYMKRIKEGDIVKITNLEAREGYRGDLEVQMQLNSIIQVLPEEADPGLPKYEETITNLEDITEDGEYNIIARIIKMTTPRQITSKDDKTLELVTLTLMDKTGVMEFNLWNKDISIIDTLSLEENDTIKILKARAQYRYDQMSLSNSWNGRIIKEDYDLPEYRQEILELKDAVKPMDDITIIGVITRIFDTITFNKNNGTTGQVKSIEVADPTGNIRVTLWNKETEITMDKGDTIKIEGANIEEDDYNGGFRLNTGWNASVKINPEIDSELAGKLEKIENFKITPVKEALDPEVGEGEEVDILGRVLRIADINTFQRDDGTDGQVRSIDVSDNTGTIKVSLWDEKTDISQALGDAVKIENARTRFGQGKMELSVGRSSRITTPTKEEADTLPSFEELQEKRFHEKTLSEIEENENDLKLKVRLMEIAPVNTFARDDGTEGKVRALYVADSTGQMQVTLWDKNTDIKFSEGSAIVIENPQVQENNDGYRLVISSDSTLRQATQDESDTIPSQHELKNILYPEKLIEDIDETDKNIKVKAVFKEIDGENILHPMCPQCNKGLKEDEQGFVCDICGEHTQNPNFLLIIPTVLEDETGTIKATFFREQAEEILGMNTQEIINIFEQTGDESALAAKVEDMIDREVTIISDAEFSEYEEDVKLNVRRIEVILD